MYSPYNSRHFTTYIDKESKARIAILSSHVAPVQQSFYFEHPAWSDDGRYLWFYCAFPPARHRSMGVIDFLTDEIHHFPEVDAGGPVDTRNGNIYWSSGDAIYMRTPHPQDQAVMVARAPKEIRDMVITGIGLGLSSDCTKIITAIQTKQGSVIGRFDLISGEFEKWHQTQIGTVYNHQQFCPTDADICSCAHEGTSDPKTGAFVPAPLVDGIYPRLQVIRRDGSRRMLKPVGNFASHEWWSVDGKKIFYCNERNVEDGRVIGLVGWNSIDGEESGVICKLDIPDGTGTWHAHCTKDEKYFVMDGFYPRTGKRDCWRGLESTVRFYNTETGKFYRFLPKNPVVAPWSPDMQCPYHIDPHPSFEQNDTMVSFTTTVMGRVDLAIVSVDQLIAATQ